MSTKDPLDRYYTPLWYARSVRRFTGDLVRTLRGDLLARGFDRVLEPSCGLGAYVQACQEAGDRSVWACDIDEQATGLALVEMPHSGDWLTWAADLEAKQVRFQLAIGNTPFGGPALKRGRNPGDPAYLGAVHVTAALRLAEVCVFTLPWSWRCTKGPMQIFPRPPSFIVPTARPFTELRELAVWIWVPREWVPHENTIILPWLDTSRDPGAS